MMELLLHQCGHGELKRSARFVFETDGREGLRPRKLENHPPLTMTHPLRRAVTPEFVPVQIFINNDQQILLPVSVEILASTLQGNEKSALTEITDVVRRLDIDIAAIDIVHRKLTSDEDSPSGITKTDRQTGAKHAVHITSTHEDVSGNPALFDFIKHESDGTQRLAGLVGLILLHPSAPPRLRVRSACFRYPTKSLQYTQTQPRSLFGLE
jgi:hypothetical protein